jgi:hypothetical protein
MQLPRFEAVFANSGTDGYAEWHVVEWIACKNSQRVARIIDRYGDCCGASARKQAELLQKSHINTPMYVHG